MPAYKSTNNGKITYYSSFYYSNWQGKRLKKLKRGFATKRDAQEFERSFLQTQSGNLEMKFEEFIKIYTRDLKNRLKLNTWQTKNAIIEKKILPFFRIFKISEIQPKDIIAWQNEMINYRSRKGTPYSPTYLKTIHNQLSCIFNHAVKFYGLKSNPAAKVGNMGKEKNKEMLFWTEQEYLNFSNEVSDKPLTYYSYQLLFYCGLRLGELLALTPKDFDFKNQTVNINKSYQRINKQDIITEPKTPKSNRIIKMPRFLSDEIQDYLSTLYGIKPTDRVFPITKSYLHHEMDRGSKLSGVKRIRIHDLRHSHVSLLIDMGFSALAIADRLGHESIDITYRYAHLFPSKQTEIANKLNDERMESLAKVR